MTNVSPAVPHKKAGVVRRLYDWVLHWADTPYAVPALFCLAFAESSFFPIPPDVLLIALAIGDRKLSFRFALWCSIASVLGGMAGYGIGHFFWKSAGLESFFFHYVPGFTAHGFEAMRLRYEEWNVWIVFLAAFTPIPYKLITITAGVFGINFPLFVLASACGRSARFFLVSGLIWRFGPPIKAFLDKYLGIVTFAGAALLIGGFFAVKYVLPHDQAAPVDPAMVLCDAQTVRASGPLTLASSARIVDLGRVELVHGSAEFDILTLDGADGSCKLSIQGSNSGDFAGAPVTLAERTLGGADAPGVVVLPFANVLAGVGYRFVRAHVATAGTAPSLGIGGGHITLKP